MNDFEISVLIPINKLSPFLTISVDSALSQLTAKSRLIVAINNCDRATSQAIKFSLNEQLKRENVHVVDCGHGSLGLIRARALEGHRSDFIALLDADDVAEAARFDLQVSFLRSNPDCVAVGSNVTLIDANGAVVGKRNHIRRVSQGTSLFDSPLTAPATMIRGSAYDRVGGFRDAHLCEDFDLWRRLLADGFLYNIDAYLTKYRIHSGQSGNTNRLVQANCRMASILSAWDSSLDPHASLDEICKSLSSRPRFERIRLLVPYLLEMPIPRFEKIKLFMSVALW